MQTVITNDPNEAAEFIRKGGTVAFPTETVYGLGADVFDERAVGKLFEAKRRPADNPLIAHISNLDQIVDIARDMDENAQKLIDAFFPGPLTVVLKKTDRVPSIATAGLGTIGVRMPRAQVAVEFLKACDTPVVAPSANLSGRPSPTTWQAVLEDLDGRIDCLLKGKVSEIGLESTVVDCTVDPPIVLRPGAVSIKDLQKVVAKIAMIGFGAAGAVKSPGLKHRHYSPKGKVVLVDSIQTSAADHASAYIGLDQSRAEIEFSLRCASVEDYAQFLFEFLRECDRRSIENIYCQKVPETGIGVALMDRLRRAAQD